MSQKKNKGESAESGETPQKINYPGLFLIILVIALIIGAPFYYLWRFDFYDRSHQVSLVCTVDVAEKSTSTSGGPSYSSSTDYIYFETRECGNLLLPLSGADDPEAMLSGFEVGKRYEFMIGETQAGITVGAREVFSFSGPVE